MRERSRERIENYAREQGLKEITLEVAEEGLALARKAMEEAMPSGHPPRGKPETSDYSITWDAAAAERMQKVPDGFMREMTGLRVEAFARQQGVKTITGELVDKKYAEWAAGSEKQSATRWEAAAWEIIQRIPSFVRGMVILEVERCAKEMGKTPSLMWWLTKPAVNLGKEDFIRRVIRIIKSGTLGSLNGKFPR